jgi:hypothetical protein
MIAGDENIKRENWMKDKINIIIETQKDKRDINNKGRKSIDIKDSSRGGLIEEMSKKKKEKEMIGEIKGTLSTEEIVNKRNTKNIKRDMIQDLFKAKMGRNIG